MSTLPERLEKRCLNCDTLVYGRYCQSCGQENSEHHMTFGHMVKHFVFDIFHFDGKFFSTFKVMLTRPGQAAKEYTEGKRARYLEPIKMYVFTSAIFFLLFFALAKTGWNQKRGDVLQADTRARDSIAERFLVNGVDITNFKSVAQFDSVQAALPETERMGWFKRVFVRRGIHLMHKHNYDGASFARAIGKDFLHRLPQAIMVMLPIYAFLLSLLYRRHRKKWAYSDHGVFTIHLFVIAFMSILILVLLQRLADWWQFELPDIVEVPLFLLPVIYLYLAMKRFYGQGRGKTWLKWGLLNLASLLCLAIILSFFVFYSFMYS
jgi:uncharacterized membrane protein